MPTARGERDVAPLAPVGLLTMKLGFFDITVLCAGIAFVALATSKMGVAGLLVATAISTMVGYGLYILRHGPW
jgi:hypothetical protein